MKKLILSAFLITAPLVGAAHASDLCDVAEADRQPIEALQQKLESEGLEVAKMKVEDGCYEVYATNAAGDRLENFYDPATFELVKSE